jgi:heterodisulfide reductase subunit A2
MVSVGRHENITLLSYSQVESVSGYVGNFSVQVRKKARYVDEQLCTGCGTCTEKCPWKKIPSEFDLGLGNRPAIYFPFAQAVPRLPVIDVENCAYFLKGKCRACEKFCPTGAINFEQQDEVLNLEVGTIILATGFKDFDPHSESQYGYGKLDNVLTGMEFERLINSGGPTSGEIRLKDGRRPEKIAIIHCVGSRDAKAAQNGSGQHAYCSRVCCMYSLKLAHLIRDSLKAEVVEFYRDMRTFGKNYESFYERVRGEGTKFVRFDGEIQVSASNNGRNGDIEVSTIDVYSGQPQEHLVDMVVLATGLEAQADQAKVGRIFGISLSPDGFFLERHPKLAPVETATDGVYLAGACQGPKDIPDSVAQGGAAAASALSLLDAGYVTLEPFTTYINQEKCAGCRTCEGLCPFNAIEMMQLQAPDGVTRTVAYINEVLCKGCGVCAAACPAAAATQHGFTHEQVFAEISGVLQEAFV